MGNVSIACRILSACCLLLHTTAAGAENISPPSAPGAGTRTAAAFELADQHDRMHSYRFPREKVSFLTIADREGSKQLKHWIAPLAKSYGTRIDILGIADLSAVPSFVERAVVRAYFRSRLDYPVMLDWSGAVCRSYEYRSAVANIFIIDTRGNIVLRKFGKPTEADLREVFKAIDQLLQAPRTSGQTITPGAHRNG